MQDVKEALIVARVALLLNHPFFGTLATRLQLKEATGDWLDTMSTDGRCIYYNSDFISKLSKKQIEFGLCHEILHVIFDHMARRDYRHPKLFNIATDYCVNGQLIRDRIGEEITTVKLFHDPKYYDMSAEEIYDLLVKEGEDAINKLGMESFDVHIDFTKPGKEGQPVYSEQEIQDIKDSFREAMFQAAQSVGAGQIPAGIRRMIEELTEPKMDWRQLLRQQIQSTVKNDFSFMRPNRKGWHISAVLPGQNFAEKIDICVSLDLSGSIGESQLRDFLSEIKGIMEEFQQYNIKLWTFDTKVYNMVDYDEYTIHKFDEYELIGGGGTEFGCNWEFMKDNDITPKKFIMFTDMGTYGDDWGDPNYCETIFIAHESDVVAPHGITVQYASTETK